MNYFFNQTIETYTIAFGDLFKNLHVQYIDESTSPPTIQNKKVPLSYSPKLHWFLRKYQSLPDDINIATTLPRMVFSLNGMDADYSERGTNKFERISGNIDWDKRINKWIQTAVPYKFTFTLSIWTNYQTELNQILEQILPFFTPARNVHVKEIPVLNVFRTCKISLGTLAQEHTVEYEAEGGKRILQYSLDFLLDGYLYPPIQQNHLPVELILNYYDEKNLKIKTETSSEFPIEPTVYGISEGIIATQPVEITVLKMPEHTYEATINDEPYTLGSPYALNGEHVLKVVAKREVNHEIQTAETIVNFEINIPPFVGPIEPFIGGVENNHIYRNSIFVWLNAEYENTIYTFTLNGEEIPYSLTIEGEKSQEKHYELIATATKDDITLSKEINFIIDRRGEHAG